MTPLTIRLREVRLAKGLTQAALATLAKVRRATVVSIEKGQTKGIDFDTLDRLASALQVNAAALIHHTPPKGNRPGR
jgi:transcriptional regulator with XRE-family HTH domain